MAQPSVGRIVHVFCRSLEHIGPYAAIITRVGEDGTTISATLFFDFAAYGSERKKDIPFSDHDGNEGRDMWWDWPERVE